MEKEEEGVDVRSLAPYFLSIIHHFQHHNHFHQHNTTYCRSSSYEWGCLWNQTSIDILLLQMNQIKSNVPTQQLKLIACFGSNVIILSPKKSPSAGIIIIIHIVEILNGTKQMMMMLIVK
mmetsp:Transcript_52611/g.59746  ORF Transcript_52611/g.59746 Transcript_52611/m.59746 type:complete len:120 (+) Transcript_52611:363-722(+)